MIATNDSEVKRAVDAAPERTRLGGVETLLASGALIAFAGAPGIVAAALIVTAWYMLSSTYAFALGQVALVALLSGADLVQIAVVEASLVGVLFAPVIAYDNPVNPIPVTLGGILFGSSIAWMSGSSILGFQTTATRIGLPTAAVLLIVTFVIIAYGLHRYQLVTLELGSDVRKRGDGT
ncbi:hypothetical protein [Haladaptatus sp. NG-SE-30]